MPSLMTAEQKDQHQESVARYERDKIEANRIQEQKLQEQHDEYQKHVIEVVDNILVDEYSSGGFS